MSRVLVMRQRKGQVHFIFCVTAEIGHSGHGGTLTSCPVNTAITQDSNTPVFSMLASPAVQLLHARLQGPLDAGEASMALVYIDHADPASSTLLLSGNKPPATARLLDMAPARFLDRRNVKRRQVSGLHPTGRPSIHML